ncbi:oxygenase MpaB family protein [Streptomyces sp. NPDC020141]|uniref:oxygenase MpaB family protein n=1 Tax=Streptomyces sp. NPDC020141 TaxID=3365065 RepID=UPI00378D478A
MTAAPGPPPPRPEPAADPKAPFAESYVRAQPYVRAEADTAAEAGSLAEPGAAASEPYAPARTEAPALDPYAPAEPDWAAYQRLARTSPKALKTGLNLAFYRCFAVPGIATALAASGGILRQPLTRAKATGLPLFQLLESGFDSPEARLAVRRLRAAHHGLPADDDAFVYVLGLFCVHPLRFMALYGPRPPTAAERAASHAFHAELGRRLGLTGVPADHDRLAEFVDAYEARSFRPTPEGRALWRSARSVFEQRLPGPLAPLGPLIAECLMDPSMRILGIGRRPAPLRALARAVVRRALAREG